MAAKKAGKTGANKKTKSSASKVGLEFMVQPTNSLDEYLKEEKAKEDAKRRAEEEQ